jgi:hypothetical protein
MRQILCERRQLRSKWQHPPLTLATVIGLNIAIEAFKSQHWWDLGALIAWIVVVSTVAYRPPIDGMSTAWARQLTFTPCDQETPAAAVESSTVSRKFCRHRATECSLERSS